MEILFLVLGVVVLGLLLWQTFGKRTDSSSERLQKMEEEKHFLLEENAKYKAQMEQQDQEIGRLQQIKKQFDESVGGQKVKEQRIVELEANEKQYLDRLRGAQKKISEFEARAEQLEEKKERSEKRLEEARNALEEERIRVRRKDEVRQAKILEEQNRIWNDHEVLVLAKLREVSEKPEIGFQTFDNQNLPDGFDGTLKPDFLVSFLGQYIIFDAKKSKDPQNYLNDQIKKTAKKCKGNEAIYSTMFFVMPDDEISQCRKLSFFEEGFSFYVIPISAIESIISNFKRITEYDKIQEFDPQDRENIVNLIANYDRHISFQNAANILLARESVDLMNTKEALPKDFQEEVSVRKRSMRNFKLKESELKKISQKLGEQEKEIVKLTSPKVAIDSDELENAQDSLQI
ncbi:hypothetical protein KAI58_01090 [Candidatus Gracilibacteria bacterium]|nr:hypothetical protein [Candidatus Gracilibacteria bacterium]